MKIERVILKGHDTSFGGFKFKFVTTVTLEAPEFKKLKGDLGSLVLDVSNELYRYYGVPQFNPTVDASRRSKNGVKTVIFTYFSNDGELAQSMGLKGFTTKADGFIPGFAEQIELKPFADNILQFKTA